MQAEGVEGAVLGSLGAGLAQHGQEAVDPGRRRSIGRGAVTNSQGTTCRMAEPSHAASTAPKFRKEAFVLTGWT